MLSYDMAERLLETREPVQEPLDVLKFLGLERERPEGQQECHTNTLWLANQHGQFRESGPGALLPTTAPAPAGIKRLQPASFHYIDMATACGGGGEAIQHAEKSLQYIQGFQQQGSLVSVVPALKKEAQIQSSDNFFAMQTGRHHPGVALASSKRGAQEAPPQSHENRRRSGTPSEFFPISHDISDSHGFKPTTIEFTEDNISASIVLPSGRVITVPTTMFSLQLATYVEALNSLSVSASESNADFKAMCALRISQRAPHQRSLRQGAPPQPRQDGLDVTSDDDASAYDDSEALDSEGSTFTHHRTKSKRSKAKRNQASANRGKIPKKRKITTEPLTAALGADDSAAGTIADQPGPARRRKTSGASLCTPFLSKAAKNSSSEATEDSSGPASPSPGGADELELTLPSGRQVTLPEGIYRAPLLQFRATLRGLGVEPTDPTYLHLKRRRRRMQNRDSSKRARQRRRSSQAD